MWSQNWSSVTGEPPRTQVVSAAVDEVRGTPQFPVVGFGVHDIPPVVEVEDLVGRQLAEARDEPLEVRVRILPPAGPDVVPELVEGHAFHLTSSIPRFRGLRG